MPTIHPPLELPVPAHFDPEGLDQVWRVPYRKRAQEAKWWAIQHNLQPANQDDLKISLLLVDVQNTFCLPEFELFVAGQSGTGAVDDNRRLAEFIYRNLHRITDITATMDTHRAMQIFHPIFLVNEQGEHPEPLTQITLEDVEAGRWRFNPQVAPNLGIDPDYGQDQLLHYVKELKAYDRYNLTIWPYHSMLGGIGHALVSAIEEALFFHTIARVSQVDFTQKGGYALTESYSAVGPEVEEGPRGDRIGEKSGKLFEKLLKADVFIIAGQAKSHCVSWTLQDLLEDIRAKDERLAQKIYLLEDCTSPVVVPDVVDYTEEAKAAFQRFAHAGMHLVLSTDAMPTWPGFALSG
jgi:nicotinamidase-related amidase